MKKIIALCLLNISSLYTAQPEPITLTSLGYPILDGQALTVIDISNLQHDPENLLKKWHTDCKALEAINTQKNKQSITNIKQKIKRLESQLTDIQPYLFWWQAIPTVGLRLEEPFWPIHYPYLPHAFPLWELAPTMGNHKDVFLLDTGIAAFALDNSNYYKKHQDLQMLVDFSQEKYNFVAHTKDILDPFEQLVEMIMDYSRPSKDNEKRIRKELPQWIHHYMNNQSSSEIVHYLLQQGKSYLSAIKNGKKILTEEGKRALREILQGEQGFKPKHAKKTPYNLVNLSAPNYQKNVIFEFLPTAPIMQNNLFRMHNDTKEDTYFSASYESGHGSHSAGIIGGLLHSYTNDQQQPLTPARITTLLAKDSGICGIAPQCHTVMIKALRSDGEVSNRTTITRAVKHAYKLGAEILNISLKVDDQLDTTAPDVIELETTLAKIPYVVVSSGNATTKVDGKYQTGIESYPAKFSSIPFDVGAFSFYKDAHGIYHCPITEISQYQKGVGPKFVMPGQNILSCGLVPNQKEDSMYVFMQGTSAAAPMTSGALALILGEFSGQFGDNERSLFLKVCYTSAMRLEDSQEWKSKTLLGTLDLRTALFTLHVLKKIKETIKQNPSLQKQYPFTTYCDHYIKAVHTVLEQMIDSFAHANKIKSSFKNNFMGFFNESLPQRSETIMKKKIFHSLEDALSYVEQRIISALDETIPLPKGYASQDRKEIKALFNDLTIDLFADYAPATKTRLALVL